jgi:drug/metabolite transporter (DMT)-like permease
MNDNDDGEEVLDTNRTANAAIATAERPRLSSAPGPYRDEHARANELEAQLRVDKAAKQKATPLYIFALPALCDLLGTTLGGIGLLWVDGSVWQMLRGSIIIFSGILSIVFLKRKFFAYHWLSIGVVTLGLAIIGVASWLGQQHKKVSDEDSGKVLLGFIFIVAGQLCSAGQMVVEETFVKNRDLHPAHVRASTRSCHPSIASLVCICLSYI